MTLVPPPHGPRGIQGHPHSRALNLSEKCLLPYEVPCPQVPGLGLGCLWGHYPASLGLWPLNCAPLRVWEILLPFQGLFSAHFSPWVVCVGFALALGHQSLQAEWYLPFSGEFGRDW